MEGLLIQVYVLMTFTDHESSTIKGVVDTEVKAQNWTKDMMAKKLVNDKANGQDIQVLLRGFKLYDQGFVYEEWEVK